MADAAAVPKDDDQLTGLPNDAQKHKRWLEEITFYETYSQTWEERGKKILKRYKDDRSPREQRVPRFNILWSNIETLKPALYSRKPKPDIERRFRDNDPVGRAVSMILERAISFYMNDEFDLAIKNAVFDRLLPGRGTMWVRYQPYFNEQEPEQKEEGEGDTGEITDNVTEQTNDDYEGEADSDRKEADGTGPVEVLDHEVLNWDYVHWQDFGHCFGRTWDEVPAAWRKVYLTRAELKARFGDEIGNEIKLDYTPANAKKGRDADVVKKATIYEIWDKAEKKALWFNKDYEKALLDERDDPLELEEFWPFPMPMFATLDNNDLMPTPDFVEYQDQAAELDEITSRIAAITKSVKVVGVYDTSAEGIQRILAEGVENQLVPVQQWAVFAERGGMKGAYELMPMDMILQTLLGLYEARDKVKADLYEITGIADIVRGASDPTETATAQSIKGKFGTLRLQYQQGDVMRFARGLVKIGSEILAKHFSLDTLKQISGIQLLTMQEKQMLGPWYALTNATTEQMKLNQAGGGAQKSQTPAGAPPQSQGQPPQQQALPAPQPQPQQQPQAGAGMPAPAQQPSLDPKALLPPQFANIDPEDLAELMDEPTWEEVYQLLHTEPMLAYKIDIETDSTIKIDRDEERQARIDFLEATGKFMQSAIQVQNPDLAPLMGKLLQFGVRGFPIGKELEAAFDVAIHKLEKDADNPSKQPSPEIMKIQGELQLQQQTAQREDQRIQLQAQTDNQQAQQQQQFDQYKLKLENDYKMAIAKLDAETRIVVAQIQAKASLKQTQISTNLDPAKVHDPAWSGAPMGDGAGPEPSIAGLIDTVVKQMQVALQGMQQSHQQMTQAMARPRSVMRDGEGNIVGIQ